MDQKNSTSTDSERKTGVLMRKSGVFPSWKKKYVVIEEGNMIIYKDDKLQKQEKVITLDDNVEIGEKKEGDLTIEISKEEKKKRRSYLFKASSQKEKEEWIQNLKPTQEKEEYKIFGKMLSEISNNPLLYDISLGVPIAVKSIVNFIKIGDRMKEEGIFRLAGNKDRMDLVRNNINLGICEFEEKEDVHVLAGILKQFVGGIPEPLLLFTNYDTLVNSARENDEVTMSTLKQIVPTLPKENTSLLKYLCEFLFEVSEYSSENKMTVRNLATVFGPNIIKGKNSDPLKLMSENDLITRAMECCIAKHSQIF